MFVIEVEDRVVGLLLGELWHIIFRRREQDKLLLFFLLLFEVFIEGTFFFDLWRMIGKCWKIFIRLVSLFFGL